MKKVINGKHKIPYHVLEAARVRTQIEKAIKATPQLAKWRKLKVQTMWNRATDIDRMLRDMPECIDMPLKRRFAIVVKLCKLFIAELEKEKKISKMSMASLGRKLHRMTPKQLDEYLEEL